MPLHYTICPADVHAHLFKVTLLVSHPDPAGQLLQLPAWIPGSYLIREFAKHIVDITAYSNKQPLAIKKLDKHTWQVSPASGTIAVIYHVYAWDPSVRGARLDHTQGFYNGSSVFLRVLGQEHLPHIVDIMPPPLAGFKTWRVATAMPRYHAKPWGFGTYQAENYDALIDYPVQMGEFTILSYVAAGVPHDMVITGHVPNLDQARLLADLEKICTAHITLFEPETKEAPMTYYLFLVTALGQGYGGLEHRSSSALLCSRNDLPVLGDKTLSDGYMSFLGLCSHEYFHTWHVKRIKPDVFVAYDLTQENYTSLLWLFEGVTSYYDDLMLLKSGVITAPAYWKVVSQTLNSVLRGEGRFKQSLSEASWDAWIKYYRQDENAPNAIVNYYTKGALLALTLDLTIRYATQEQFSLDDVMRRLWQTYGRDIYTPQNALKRGVTPDEVICLIEEIAGVPMQSFFERYVYGTEDLPLLSLLPLFGVTCTDKRAVNRPTLLVKLSAEGLDCKVGQVLHGGAAYHAGISAGDILVACDHLRIVSKDAENQLARLLNRYQVGEVVTLHVFRGDELMTFRVTLQGDISPQWLLVPSASAK